MPPKRKNDSSTKGAATKKTKNDTEKEKCLKTEDKKISVEEDVRKWSFTNSWEFTKTHELGPKCATSRNELLVVGSEDERYTYPKKWKIYVFDVNGELLRKWALGNYINACPRGMTEVYFKEEKRSYLVLSYGYYKIIEFRDLESGEVKREFDLNDMDVDVVPGKICKTPGNLILVENLRAGAGRDKERLALLDISSKLTVVKKFEPKNSEPKDFCCVPDPETPDDPSNHLTIVTDQKHRYMACFDKHTSAMYWKITKLPNETSSFGSKWAPREVYPLGTDQLIVLQGRSVMIYDVYGKFIESFEYRDPGKFVAPVVCFVDCEKFRTMVVIIEDVVAGKFTAQFYKNQVP